MDTVFYNRASGREEPELILGDGFVRFAYQSAGGKALWWALFRRSLVSRLMGLYADSSISRMHVAKVVRNLRIDMADFVVPDGGYRSFNDFFTRRLKAGARHFAASGLCSPADCRLSVYPCLREDLCIPVKGREFSLGELLFGNASPPSAISKAELLSGLSGGSLCVFRLCPSDYHRYHFPCGGRILAEWMIPGGYHSVHPIALAENLRVFTTNVRHVSILELDGFGTAAYVEVGAFGVASICGTFKGSSFCRGDEKGFFKFGGSTVIMAFRPGAVKYDADILERSAKGMECLVKAGEHLGD